MLKYHIYMVHTMHCDTAITIKTNKMQFCYNSFLKNFMVRAMKAHHQDDSCGIQALWYSSVYGSMVNHQSCG